MARSALLFAFALSGCVAPVPGLPSDPAKKDRRVAPSASIRIVAGTIGGE